MDERDTRYTEGKRVQRPQRRKPRFPGWLSVAILLLAFAMGLAVGRSWHKSMEDKAPPHDDPPGIVEQGGLAGDNTPGEDTPVDDSALPWNLTLVNRWNPLPENYEVNLVEVEGGERVDERIYEPLMEMLEAAKEGNWDKLPIVVSGYRTQEKQQSLYDDKIAKYRREGYSESEAKELAEQWVAIPGTSEHQLGFAVDINGATYDVYLWLQANSYKYGFIFRYPGNKTDITGVAEEVWHYRYVGVEAATDMYEQGLCLEEYLESLEESVKPV